jgi:superfamily II DNA helicase RecQ
MKAKLFQVRLAKDHAEQDQESMNSFLDTVTVKRMSTDLVAGSSGFWSVLVFFESQKTATISKVSTPKLSTDKFFFPADTTLDDKEQRSFDALKQWRYEKAQEIGLPPFMICSNSELITVVKVKPKLFEDFNRIKGFGAQKIAKYSDDMLAVIHSV